MAKNTQRGQRKKEKQKAKRAAADGVHRGPAQKANRATADEVREVGSRDGPELHYRTLSPKPT